MVFGGCANKLPTNCRIALWWFTNWWIGTPYRFGIYLFAQGLPGLDGLDQNDGIPGWFEVSCPTSEFCTILVEHFVRYWLNLAKLSHSGLYGASHQSCSFWRNTAPWGRECSSTSSRVFWKPGVPCFSFPGMSNPKKIWESDGFYRHLPLCW